MISEEIDDVEGGKTCTTVIVNMYLRSINDIDDYKMEFSVQVTFREQWNDERLKFDDFGGKLSARKRKKIFYRSQRAEEILNKISNNINKIYTGLISVLQGFQKCIA